MVDSFLKWFNQLKTVLCVCPECSSLIRLSELHLRSKGKAPKTWLDDYELSQQKIDRREDRFEDIEDEIRQKAVARGRRQVPKLIRKSVDNKFAKLNYDPYDVKALLHPIDFVVFNGMNKDRMKDVVLLSRKSNNPFLNKIHKGISSAIRDKAYDWKVLRVSEDGKVDYE